MDLDELYQEIILDHYKKPRHFRKLSEAEAMVDEENPTCGDHIRLNAGVGEGRLTSIDVDCEGCAICTASASMMAEKVLGDEVVKVRELIRRFNDMMRGGEELSEEELGDLVALKGVRKFPLRIKCATMPWHGLKAALDQLESETRS
ncbi:MAG TPA: SUF system NifU family Fe-S cluster assembly protein [Kiritimatiellia bacterium]|nr:SUF system NifU family Fe-S cluster assembly protein [Kiritimatiellia bacterium]